MCVGLQVSSYTANLAAFLTTSENVEYSLASVSDALTQQLPICVHKGGHTPTILNSLYHSPPLRLVEIESNRSEVPWDLVRAMRENMCRGAVMSSFRAGRVMRNNQNCDTAVVGDRLIHQGSGFVTARHIMETNGAGVTRICNNIASDVFGIFMAQMYETGKVDKLYRKYETETSTVECTIAESGSDVDALNVLDLAGIFIIHVVLCGVTVVWRVVQLFRRGRHISDPNGAADTNVLEQAAQTPGSLLLDRQVVLDHIKMLQYAIENNPGTSVVKPIEQETKHMVVPPIGEHMVVPHEDMDELKGIHNFELDGVFQYGQGAMCTPRFGRGN